MSPRATVSTHTIATPPFDVDGFGLRRPAGRAGRCAARTGAAVAAPAPVSTYAARR